VSAVRTILHPNKRSPRGDWDSRKKTLQCVMKLHIKYTAVVDVTLLSTFMCVRGNTLSANKEIHALPLKNTSALLQPAKADNALTRKGTKITKSALCLIGEFPCVCKNLQRGTQAFDLFFIDAV